jgi:hypothetical protein
MTTQYEVRSVSTGGRGVLVDVIDTLREAQERFNDWAESLQHETVSLFERGAAGERVEWVRWRISADVEAGIEAVNRQLRAGKPARRLAAIQESLMRDPRPPQRALAILDELRAQGIDVAALRKAVEAVWRG